MRNLKITPLHSINLELDRGKYTKLNLNQVEQFKYLEICVEICLPRILLRTF